MPPKHVETLWREVITTVGHLMYDIDYLDQQFNDFRTDPARTAGSAGERFAYKVNVNFWYRSGMRHAKAQLQERIASYWTTEPAAIEWMKFYNEERLTLNAKKRAVVETRMHNYEGLLKKMEERVRLMFTDMRQMVLLNPGGSGTEGDRMFDDNGPLMRGAGDTMSWMDIRLGSAST